MPLGQKTISSILFSFMIVFGIGPAAHAESTCSLALQSVKDTWRAGNTDVFMAFRSNAPHYWAWAKQEASAKIPKELLVEGLAAGDTHVLNFGEILINKEKFSLQLVDLDDSGRAPLIFDLIRLMVSVDVSPADTRGKDVFKAYFKGLRGEDFQIPDFIHSDEKLSVSDFLKAQSKNLEKNVKDGKLDLDAYGLKPMKTATKKIQEAEGQILRKLAKTEPHWQHLDGGWMSHPDGGSQGMDRIWMLFKVEDGSMILREYKQMAPPATSNYRQQVKNETRINEVREAYWKTDKTDEYEVMSVGAGQFLSRNRYDYPMDEDIKAAISKAGGKLADLSEYLGYRLGQLHAQQDAGKQLLKNIDNNEKMSQSDVFDLLKKLRDDYVNLVKDMVKSEH